MYKPPKAIKHRGVAPQDSRKEMVADCANAMHLAKGSRKVLAFYARCGNSFRPAVQTIMSETGLSKSQILRDRDELVRKGIIAVTSDKIIVDWNRIKCFAMLDPKMTRKNVTCLPVPVNYERPHIDLSELLTMDDDALVEKLATMSEAEFKELRRKAKQLNQNKGDKIQY